MTAATERRLSIEGADQQLLAGVSDSNLTTLARHCDIRVVLRHDHMILSGPRADVDRASPTARRMIRYARLRRPFDAVDVERFLDAPDSDADDISSTRFPDGEAAGSGRGRRPSGQGGDARGKGRGRGRGRGSGKGSGTESGTGRGNGKRKGRGEDRQPEVALAGARRAIRPKSPGQDRYLASIRERDVVVGIGPAGTGKTYLAVAAAVEALNRKRVRRIILTRPAVEAGEALGFLPGDIREKVDPYLRPLYDALEDMLPPDRVRRLIEDRVIEVAPLAYMRGRTLSDAFLILDEAQNATTAQMKMFLTRLGLNSRTVITGDKTQIDLPRPEDSGLIEIEDVLRKVEGIDFVYLDDADVVRHRLVKEIIRAYRESER